MVAKTMNNVGVQDCWVMASGFSGRKGWAQSRLGTDSFNLSVVEVAVAGDVGDTAGSSAGAVDGNATTKSQRWPPGRAPTRRGVALWWCSGRREEAVWRGFGRRRRDAGGGGGVARVGVWGRRRQE
jgi:hypothetical protein